MLHPSPISRIWESRVWETKNEKSHPRPEKAPNGINAADIDGRVGCDAERNLEVFTQTPSAARELFRYARIHVRRYSDLASPALSMRSQHVFYACGSNDAQRRLMIQWKQAQLSCNESTCSTRASYDQAVHSSRPRIFPIRTLRHDGRRDAQECIDGRRRNQSEP